MGSIFWTRNRIRAQIAAGAQQAARLPMPGCSHSNSLLLRTMQSAPAIFAVMTAARPGLSRRIDLMAKNEGSMLLLAGFLMKTGACFADQRDCCTPHET